MTQDILVFSALIRPTVFFPIWGEIALLHQRRHCPLQLPKISRLSPNYVLFQFKYLS